MAKLHTWSEKSWQDALTSFLLLLTSCATLLYSGCAGLTSPAAKSQINTPPTVSITSPASGAQVSGTITVSANATDSVAVKSLQFQVDGHGVGSAITSAPYSYSLNTTTLANGNHSLTAVATDTSNLSTTSAAVTINVNNASASPSVSITSPVSGATVSGTITVIASVSSGIGSVQFLLDSADLGMLVTTSPYSTSWNTTTVADGTHTLTASAKDNSGITVTSAPVTVAVANATSGNANADFQARCGAPGVILCNGFDTTADIQGGSPPAAPGGGGVWRNVFYNNGNTGTLLPVIDSAHFASGNGTSSGSLMFTIPAQSGADSSGAFFTNFAPDDSVQFGANADFYVQWRQMFDPVFITAQFAGGSGWKQVDISQGDFAACSPSSQIGNCTGSCSNIEVVPINSFMREFPQIYQKCPPSNPLEIPFGASDFELQNAVPNPPGCLYSQGSTSYFPPIGGCVGYFPNEWMTFQIHIHTGNYNTSTQYYDNSLIEYWVARQGQPSVLIDSWNVSPAEGIFAGSPAQLYGKIWLLPYNTGKDPTVTYPETFTWYDELIISAQRIPDPKF
jgi:hypothetical protein